MSTIEELQPLVAQPREALDAEYKTWLDLTTNDHRAVLAKAAIALANHGGGYIIIGLDEQNHQFVETARPANIPEITQDGVNAAIRRYATPEFHCETYRVPHPTSQIEHPIIVVPGGMTEPVMSKRDCPNVIAQNRVYIRKPGPRSEEPQTGEEWRSLMRRCVQNGREDMLDAIRSIVSGRVEPTVPAPNAQDALHAFCEAARARWQELVANLPVDDPAKFPLGYYDFGASLVGATPAGGLAELQERLAVARQIRLTGWSTFLAMSTPEWAPYIHDDFIEAWVGCPRVNEERTREPAHCDFWRATPDGKIYTIRGYTEDGLPRHAEPGTVIDVTMPVWRVGEALLFSARLADTFQDVETIMFECTFTGLDGRGLTSLSGDRASFGEDISRTNAVTLRGQATPQQLRDNLAEVVRPLLAPLYERFDFFRLPVELVETELGRLRRGQF